MTIENLARVHVSENVGDHSAQVLRIANQCPVVFGFQNISACVIELYLVGSEVLYIKSVFVVHCDCVYREERDSVCVCARVCTVLSA